MNYIKQVISLTGILLFFLSCQSQTNPINSNPKQCNCNLVDSQGKKYGLWIENKGCIEVYYKNNQRDGVYKAYYRKNGKLSGLGEYKNGKKSEKWYYFDESSHIIFTEENIKDNSELSRTRDDGVKVTPKYSSYLKIYYSNGMVKEEGAILYDEDVEIDYYKTSIWKYYDEEGKLTSTREEH